jgi:hypothetical protein
MLYVANTPTPTACAFHPEWGASVIRCAMSYLRTSGERPRLAPVCGKLGVQKFISVLSHLSTYNLATRRCGLLTPTAYGR